VPEESNFEGSILENWELLSDGVISSNGNGVLGLKSEVVGERLKFMVRVKEKRRGA
jgi:hypothetical protein